MQSNLEMYSDWAPEFTPQYGCGDEAAISAFKDAVPWNVGKEFVAGTAKHLATSLGLTKPGPTPKSKIVHDKQLQVLMPALGYGLSFPLNEIDILRDCVTVYCEWLSALLPKPKVSVPLPIIQDPNHYGRIIINHFYYLFVPRGVNGADVINRQAVLCHRVLRALQNIAQNSTCMNEDTWQTLLLFLLHINSALLSPPTMKVVIRDDTGEQLCERVLSVLFETWLLACSRCFPPPPLWHALRESCLRWRHRVGLIHQWCRVTYALTAKLIAFLYGPDFPKLTISDEDMSAIPSNMTNDCIAQVWFRILHIVGNPADLSRHSVISKTPAFLKYAISSDHVIEPSHHPCLQQLPSIFFSAMKGISSFVDAFLGISSVILPPEQPVRKSSSSSNSISSEYSLESENDVLRSVSFLRPKCNSVLHLFGPWLFEAALINSSIQSSLAHQHGESRKVSNIAGNVDLTKQEAVSPGPEHFQSGRAEALGALCRIFSSKKTGEEILPVYSARFYIAIKEGLHPFEEFVCSPELNDVKSQLRKKNPCNETATSILMNGVDLFRLDLEGVVTLVPSILGVLCALLPEKELQTLPTSPPVTLLRRAGTHLLLSLLALPFHFQGVGVKELGKGGLEKVKLSHLRPQIVNLLFSALQVETDSINTHMLLGGLLFCVQDSALCEAVDSVSQCSYFADRKPHIFSSSTCDTLGSSGGEVSSLSEEAGEFGDSSGHFSGSLQVDSAHALFVRAIYLVCHQLISSWKTDIRVSLAGLELLAGLARVHIIEQDWVECRRAVRWLCDYIAYQCSRPPQAHSKNLHSTIVAAFHCANVWLVAHPYLLQDKDCLLTVLEVIELGISGSKSQVKPNDSMKMKHEKELKPASMRVRDAAEALLSSVLSQVGNFPSMCGAESTSSLMDEVILLRHCNSWAGAELQKDSAVQHFRYFVSQNSILMALLEQPLVNHQDPQPTVTMLIRGPSGRTAWTLQLRHLPRHQSSSRLYMSNPGRPLPVVDVGVHHSVTPKYFPDTIDRIPLCKADKSIPSLESIIHSSGKAASEHEKLMQILEDQILFEEKIGKKVESQTKGSLHVEVECSAPEVCSEFQTARLLLSHFGLLSLEALQDSPSGSSSLVALDSSQAEFAKDLDILDSTNSRTANTVHIFYVKSGQNNPADILSNVHNSDCVHQHFLELINSLGWCVDVSQHPGWTGHISNSYRVFQPCDHTDADASEDGSVRDYHGGDLYNGEKHVLYWADALSELAFVVPTRHAKTHAADHQSHQFGDLNIDKRSGGSCSSVLASEHSDSLTACECFDMEAGESSLSSHTSQISGPDGKKKLKKSGISNFYKDQKLMLVWLESYDDFLTFPIVELQKCTVTGLESPGWKNSEPNYFIIFIHSLQNGLFRIKLQGCASKLGLAGPLVDGQVVSRRAMPSLIRQTFLNAAWRKTLESDSYQPPHVRRKLKIQDMVSKYHCRMNEPQFYTHLFTDTLR